jgi:hypothetical protein
MCVTVDGRSTGLHKKGTNYAMDETYANALTMGNGPGFAQVEEEYRVGQMSLLILLAHEHSGNSRQAHTSNL